MSSGLDLCFVKATTTLQQAARHVMQQGSCGDHLKDELKEWLAGVSKSDDARQQKKTDGYNYFTAEPSISFQLVVKIHQQLQVNPLDTGPTYLHELLNGSSLCLPEVKFPPKDPKLVARLERVQAAADNKAYQRMVKNVDVSRDNAEFYQLGLEVQATSRQMWTVINFLLTVVGGFMFGFFVAYYAGFGIPACVCVGLVFGTVIFLADLYFIVRTDLVPPKRSREKSKTRKSQTKQKLKSD